MFCGGLCGNEQRIMASLILRRGLCKVAAAHSNLVGVLGVPMWRGQKKPGTDIAPAKLREESELISGVQTVIGQQVKDYGDVDFSDCGQYNTDGSLYMAAASRLIRDSVSRCLRDSATLVTLGGDHSMAIGTVAGHADYANQHGM